jgi:Flp pilus assembly pilin Flp
MRARACTGRILERGARDQVPHDSGATAVEYAILASLVAAVVIAAVLVLGGKANNMLGKPCQELISTSSPC